MRILSQVLIAALFASASIALRERWGMNASLWFLGTLLVVWFMLWLVLKHLHRKLRERGIEIPDEDG